jgi:CheY-like chemotaxis protein
LTAVLLVDDDAEFLAEMRTQLERLTPDVYVAQSPLEALWLLHHVDVDAIVCDLHLGATDGLRLLEQVRAERPELARVLLTGVGDEAAGHAALSAPAPQVAERRPMGRVIDAKALPSLGIVLKAVARPDRPGPGRKQTASAARKRRR